jgi:hypothetical protein
MDSALCFVCRLIAGTAIPQREDSLYIFPWATFDIIHYHDKCGTARKTLNLSVLVIRVVG